MKDQLIGIFKGLSSLILGADPDDAAPWQSLSSHFQARKKAGKTSGRTGHGNNTFDSRSLLHFSFLGLLCTCCVI